jgi:uncharacterized membrane protein
VPGRFHLVIGAGIFEIACAYGSIFSRTRRPASLAIMSFLLLVIPLNIYDIIMSPDLSTFTLVILLMRVTFLSLLSYWAYYNSRLF